MLVNETVKIIVNKRNKNYLKEKGYDIKDNGEEIEVKIRDLQKGVHQKILVKCDYCGEIFEKAYYHYVEQRAKLPKDACKKCCKIKNEEIMKLTYGENIKSPLQVEKFKEQVKETNLKKYGVDNPAKNKDILKKIEKTNFKRYGYSWVGSNPEFREKQEKVMEEKYGVRNVFCKGELREQSYYKTLKTKFKNKSFPVSKNQKYLSELYNCEYNYLVLDHYFLDLYFQNTNIYCEYDGGGHDLNVKLNQISREEFDKKEKQRFHILKRNGYKMFKIINKKSKEKLPSDEILLKFKELSFNFLNEENNYYIVLDLDKNLIHTKEKDINLKNITDILKINQI